MGRNAWKNSTTVQTIQIYIFPCFICLFVVSIVKPCVTILSGVIFVSVLFPPDAPTLRRGVSFRSIFTIFCCSFIPWTKQPPGWESRRERERKTTTTSKGTCYGVWQRVLSSHKPYDRHDDVCVEFGNWSSLFYVEWRYVAFCIVSIQIPTCFCLEHIALPQMSKRHVCCVFLFYCCFKCDRTKSKTDHRRAVQRWKRLSFVWRSFFGYRIYGLHLFPWIVQTIGHIDSCLSCCIVCIFDHCSRSTYVSKWEKKRIYKHDFYNYFSSVYGMNHSINK